MNDQSNPLGTDQTEMAAKASGRRRLVRGAVALAPVVLTLRSGALAAASCTGAVAIGKLTAVNENGNGNGTKYKFTPDPGSNSLEPDKQVCVTAPSQCNEYATAPNPHLKISGGEKNGTLRLKTGDKGYLYCDGTGYSDNQTVAILSSLSASSLYPTTGR